MEDLGHEFWFICPTSELYDINYKLYILYWLELFFGQADSPNVCSGQRLNVSTYEVKQPDDIMSYPIMTIHENGQELTVEYYVNDSIERKVFFNSTFTLTDSRNEFETQFSKLELANYRY